MKIAVIGTGYVGLVTGTCLAEFGNTVICVDNDVQKVADLKKGKVPIYEPDLDTYIARNISERRLSFTQDRLKAISDADIVLLALPTPPNEDGSADLHYILEEAQMIAPHLKKGAIVVNKSTVPAGTAKRVEDIIDEFSEEHIDVVSNPEFLREGMAVSDFFYPDRVVVGVGTQRARRIMRKLYEPLDRNSVQILFMDRNSAELSKYASNSFLAAKISFMNEIANLCEKLGADVDAVRKVLGSDTRIGNKFLSPGIGYGGSCFPKDLIGLVRVAEEYGQELGIISAAIAANSRQQSILVDKLLKYFNGDITGKHFAMWGLAFKPNTDDVREAPAKTIINRLIGLGATVTAYDPEANHTMTSHFKGVKGFKTVDDQYQALKDAEALLIATEWQEFYSPDFVKIKQQLKNHVIFDGRNIFSENDIKRAGGIHYVSIGRRTVQS